MPGNRNSGRGGLPPKQRARALRLLDRGWPKARIARVMGIDRGTVQRLAGGRHVSQRGETKQYLLRCDPLSPRVLAKFWADGELSAADRKRITRAVRLASERLFRERIRWADATPDGAE